MAIDAKRDNQYAIKYRIIPLDKNQTILYPITLVKGIETEDGFKTESGLIPFSYENLSNAKYAVDIVLDKSELEFIYQYIEDDNENSQEAEDFLSKYFYEDFKDTLIYIENDLNKGYTTRSEINLRILRDNYSELAYVLDKALPSVILNEGALKELSECNDINEVKLLLRKYRDCLLQFQNYNKSKGITKISVFDGKIDGIETSYQVEEKGLSKYKSDIDTDYTVSKRLPNSSDVTYRGLTDYIKERVFGHDEEIDTFAQKLYMNYTAEDGDAVESILLVGPTGVGKTETVNAACEYLDIPSFTVNASNIVPQGIKGMSIEDVIVGLYVNADYDENRAQRGLIFLDEFDKLNESDLETKAAVKNILLTFTAGGEFPIDNDRFTFSFNSKMTNKVYAGVFQDILNNSEKHIGFSDIPKVEEVLDSEEMMREKIISSGYFSLEELSRISSLLGFKELDKETKKRILLDSKLSELVKKRQRYKRQFGVDLVVDDLYIDAILEQLSKTATGMRSVNNIVKRTMNHAERALLEENSTKGKKLVLTKETVEDFSSV